MITAIAILLALFVLPSPWGILAVGAGAAIDLGETFVFWSWSQRRRARVGVETLVGRTAVASSALDPSGQVKLDGELWRARSEAPVESGAEVVVRAVEGLTLVVESRPGDWERGEAAEERNRTPDELVRRDAELEPR